MVLIGIVGKTNVGKSTFFKALTMASVEIENRPFVTINPNKGVGFVKVEDPGFQLGLKSQPREGYLKGKYRFVPIDLMDVAGLVPGAHEGRGLGNKFLDDLRQSEGMILVLDLSGSTNEEGEFIEPGAYEPWKDLEWVINELDMWLLNIFLKNYEKMKKTAKAMGYTLDKILLEIFSGLGIKKAEIEETLEKLKIDKSEIDLDINIIKNIISELRKTSKPIIVFGNRVDINIDIAKENIKEIKRRFPEIEIIPGSALAEVILKELDKNKKIEYIPGEPEFKILDKLNTKEEKAIELINQILSEFSTTGVQNTLDKLVFDLLNYIPVFPVANERFTDNEGRIFPDCYLVKKGSSVIELAEKIHSDLAKNFIRAIELRSKKTVGKDYVLNYSDIIYIISR